MRVARAIVVMLLLHACTSPPLTTVDQGSPDGGRAGPISPSRWPPAGPAPSRLLFPSFQLASLGANGGTSGGGGSWMVSTLAGNDGFHDGTGGPNGTAAFKAPYGVALDAAGDIFVADFLNNRIRKIGPTGNVTTLAGNGKQGFADGTGGAFGTAEFFEPLSVAVDSHGYVYVADCMNNRVRKIAPDGTVTTLAGNGTQGHVDGSGGPNGTAELTCPTAVAVDASGNVFDVDWNSVRKIDPAGNVTTIAGSPKAGYADGPGAVAEFNNLSGIAIDASGNIYVGDGENERIRKIDPQGNVTTLAGNGIAGFADGTGGPSGTAEFDYPRGVAVDGHGNVYVADTNNYRVRKIDTSGNVSTFAGNGVQGYVDGSLGPSGTAEFYGPTDVAISSQGALYIADSESLRIREVDASGTMTTVAGTGGGSPVGWARDGTGGPYGSAQFYMPQGVAVDSQGNVYVGDTWDNRVRKIDPSGNVTTLAGNGVAGFVDGPGATAEFSMPCGVAVDALGNVFVADSWNAAIRKIDPDGRVTTLAGNGFFGSVDGPGGPTGPAEFMGPVDVAVDSHDNVYVADARANRIRKIDPSGNVTTLAGNGVRGFADGTGGASGSAEFNLPYGVAVGAGGELYVADNGNERIRRIDTTGQVTTFAGNGTPGRVDGTGGPNGTAEFFGPSSVAVDRRGNVYVAEDPNIVQIDPFGNVTTLAGTGHLGWVDGVGEPNGVAAFNDPLGVAVDRLGEYVYVADFGNSRIRMVTRQ